MVGGLWRARAGIARRPRIGDGLAIGLQQGNYAMVLELARVATLAAQAAVSQAEREVTRNASPRNRRPRQSDGSVKRRDSRTTLVAATFPSVEVVRGFRGGGGFGGFGGGVPAGGSLRAGVHIGRT